jgi:hypothetical protein
MSSSSVATGNAHILVLRVFEGPVVTHPPLFEQRGDRLGARDLATPATTA